MRSTAAEMVARAGWRRRALYHAMPPVVLVILVSWLCIVSLRLYSADLQPGTAAGEPFAWQRLADLFAIWSLVLSATLLPSLLPMMAGYVRFLGKSDNPPPPVPRVLTFTAGYLSFMLLIAAPFALLQAVLISGGLMTADGARLADPLLGGFVLLWLAIFQWSPWKVPALQRCRSAIGFFMLTWRDGVSGAYVMGLRQGLCCLGACGALLLLLFVAGVTSPAAIAALAIYLVIEKTAPRITLVTRVAGLVFLAAAGWLILVDSAV